MTAVVGTFPWAVLLCRFPDFPEIEDANFFRDLFVRPGTRGVFDYWKDVSYGAARLDRSDVFGWFTMPHPLSFYNQYSNRTNPIRRYKLWSDGAEAAAAQGGVQLTKFFGLVVILNTAQAKEVGSVDGGLGELTVGGGRKNYGLVVLDRTSWSAMTAAHEMGHGFGWDDSFGQSLPGDPNAPRYGDKWDIMSVTNVLSSPSAKFEKIGPEPNAPNRDKFGWIPSGRIAVVRDGFQDIELTSLNAPNETGFLTAKLFPFKGADGALDETRYYTVEYRRPVGADASFSTSLILVHEVRNDGRSYLMFQPAGPASPVGDDFLRAGQAYVDPANRAGVGVLRIDPTTNTATVRVISGRRDDPHVGSGNVTQGKDGLIGNFELVVPIGGRLAHYRRENDVPTLPWRLTAWLPEMATAIPGLRPVPTSVSLIQSNLGASGNLELVASLRQPRGGNLLAFWYFDAREKRWHGPNNMIADEQASIEATGNPALIQSRFGRQGNFELVVPQGDRLVHYWRDNDRPERPWHRGAALSGFGAGIPALKPVPVGVSIFQSNLGGAGNLEVLARFHGQSGDFLASYYLDNVTKDWHGPFPVTVGGGSIAGVTGAPAAIQSNLGRQGNFEVLVPQGDRLHHYWRDNDQPDRPWRYASALRGFGSGEVPALQPIPIAVSMFQSNFGRPGNLEVIVRFRRGSSDFLGFYFFDASGRSWHGPHELIADERPIGDVTGF